MSTSPLPMFPNLPIDPDSLPKAKEQPYHGLSPAYKQVQLIGTLVFAGFLLSGAAIGVTIFEWWGSAWRLLAVLGASALIIGGRLLLLYRGFRRKQYALRTHDLTYQRGLIRFTVTSIPFNRVQHCEVGQGALERLFELAHLKVYTAGGSSSDLTIPGLPPERAYQLKDYVLARHEEVAQPEEDPSPPPPPDENQPAPPATPPDSPSSSSTPAPDG